MIKTMLISILVFDGVEELDFVGPLEVFGMASGLFPQKWIRIVTLGQKRGVIQGTHGLKFLPDVSRLKGVVPDVCIVPGGLGARQGITSPSFMKWIQKSVSNVPHILSVCTGSLLLAKLGLLEDLDATTHWSALKDLKRLEPSCRIKKNVRYVDSGRIVTSAGVAAGIDASLYLLGTLLGKSVAQKTAKRMEYPIRP